MLLATGRFVGEGFDHPRLDTLFLALPVSWRGTIAQYVGRLHRLHEGKREVRVYDFAVLNVTMLTSMFDRPVPPTNAGQVCCWISSVRILHLWANNNEYAQETGIDLMIAQVEPAAGSGGPQTYQIEVFLSATQPRIWRRLQVPGNANLGWLHAVLQVAMGWTNSHLHQFICGEHIYADPSAQLGQYESDPPVLDERKATLAEIVPGIRDVLVYEYDFGDSWEHMVVVERILNAPPSSVSTALCLAGARACPPEDCGGVTGYEELLKVLKYRKHPEHKSMKEWLGRPFDADVFDLANTNTWLRKLKWPRVTEGQLRKVLMARDGYHE